MEKIFNNQNIVSELRTVFVPSTVNNIKVSVIVPTYNNEKYLPKCLLSLVKQTLKDIEIIVVNDGSTDSTKEILEIFSKFDFRIKVLNQENKKQGAARNNGLKIAQGEYVGYVDSDDWVDLDYFEKLYDAAKKYDSDIALATNIRVGNGKAKKRLNIKEEKFVTILQDKIDIGKQSKNPCPTNKIYKKSLLVENEIFWQEGVFCEDKLFTIQAIYYANGVVCVPDINYYYFRNPTSTVKARNKKHQKKLKEDKEKAKKCVLDFLKEKNADIKDKEFWATTLKIHILGILFLSKKESLKTEKYYLFSFIKIFERKINEK